MTSSDFYASVEMRWFFHGSPPASLWAQWDTDEERRQDRYLVFPNATTAGVKFREGLFEIKCLVAELAEWGIAGCSGRMQRWEKWSATREDFRPAEGCWVEVDKTRRTRYGDLRYGGRCQQEISRIGLGRETSWSLAMEAFGATFPKLEAGLRDLADGVVPPWRESCGAVFDSVHSMGYPAWLQGAAAARVR